MVFFETFMSTAVTFFMLAISGSMHPVMQEGNVYEATRDFEFEDLQIGDVIVFTTPTDTDAEWQMVSHRIVSIDEEDRTVDTLGDNNNGTQIEGVDLDIPAFNIKGVIESLSVAAADMTL